MQDSSGFGFGIKRIRIFDALIEVAKVAYIYPAYSRCINVLQVSVILGTFRKPSFVYLIPTPRDLKVTLPATGAWRGRAPRAESLSRIRLRHCICRDTDDPSLAIMAAVKFRFSEVLMVSVQ